jgi:type II secretory pathway component GspD/PulD (secretin)
MFKRKKRVEKSRAVNGMATWCLALAALGAMALAQVEPFVAPQPVPEVVESTQLEAPDVAEDELGAQAIQSLSFKEGTTISAALRFLQVKYQKNIIPISRMDDQITVFELFNLTFEEALQAIIGINKFKVQENGSITVYTVEEYEQMMDDMRRMEFRIFTLYYISAEEAKKLITPVVSEVGSIEATQAPVVGISSGDDLSVEEGGNSMSLHDAIVMKDYPENITQAESLIKQLDVRPLQVLIEATILAATLTEGLELGIDLNFAGGVSITGSAASGGVADDVLGGYIEGSQTAAGTPIEQVANWGTSGNPIEVAGFAAVGGNGLRLGLRTGDISAFITALETVTDVTILANPKILALNKQVGTVFVGQNLGYRSSTTVSGSGVAASGEVKFLKSGTKLSFRPYISNDGYIRMDIYPKDSSATKDSDGVPTETTAELTTNILVRDGETIVIGGLFRDSITSSKSQVPLLGELPILGELFKGTADSSVRQEVIILLTPHIIESPSELEGDKRAADIEMKRFGARKGLHWLSVARLSEDSYTKAVSLYSDGAATASLRELNWTLNLRPTYLEALRLRERIVREGAGRSAEVMERVMLHAIELEESRMWIRQ